MIFCRLSILRNQRTGERKVDRRYISDLLIFRFQEYKQCAYPITTGQWHAGIDPPKRNTLEAKEKYVKGTTYVFPAKAVFTRLIFLCANKASRILSLRLLFTNVSTPLLLFIMLLNSNAGGAEVSVCAISDYSLLNEKRSSGFVIRNNSELLNLKKYTSTRLPGMALPIQYEVSGGGSYCEGGSGVTIGLSGSETGVTYELLIDGSASGITLPGTGNALSFTNNTLPGTYTILATSDPGSETALMNGSATITVLANPLPPASGGNQTICSNQAIPALTVSTGTGETADWYSTASGGTPLATGSNAFTPTGAGTYYAAARNTTTYCISSSRTGVVLTINTVPTVSALPANQTICPGIAIGQINITNPNNVTGTSFSWTRDNTTILTGIDASGSGSTISGILNSSQPNTLQTTTFTITATANACSGSTTAIITVGDIIDPVITCPTPVASYNTDAGQCHTALSFSATATDDCGIQHIKYYIGAAEITFPYNFPSGSSVVTATATDLSGNSASCNFTVVVADNQLPGITCPTPAASYNTDAGQCHTALSFSATASDNCGIQHIKYYIGAAEITFPYNFPSGSSVVTATATDLSGNSASCTFTVVVADNQLPFITCPSSPQNLSVDAGACTYTVSGNELNPSDFGDNCTGSTIMNNYSNSATLEGAVFPMGQTTIIWTVTAANMQTTSCNLIVNVTDNQGPVITNCPADIVVYTGPGRTTCDQIASWTPPSASDNCGGAVTLTQSHAPGSLFPVGTTLVTYTFTDASGNQSLCSFNVTVSDNTLPTFTKPANITIYVNTSCTYNAGVAFTGDVLNEFDNCTPSGLQATYTDLAPVAGTCSGTYTITRIWTLTDNHGNSTIQNQIINVADNIKPVLTAPANITIQCHQSTLPATTGQATASDNCGGTVTISYSDNTTAGICASASTITRTWTATDCSGNTLSRTQIINVIDNVPPTIVSVANLTVDCPSDIPLTNPSVITATDNCGPVSIVLFDEIPYGLDNQPGYCPYRVDRIYRVTDQCGNYTDATQVIVVTSQCGCSPCATSNSFFTVDLSGQPGGSMTFNNVSRQDKCCDAKKEQCVSFNVKLDEDAVGVQISIDGATPSPQDWRIDCESVSIIGDIICIPGGRFYLFTYCKPGGNTNNFTFTSIAGVVVASDITARVSCNTQITVGGNATNSVWNSISPGTPGQYNGYLSCTDCPDPVFTPDENAPPEIYYQICGGLPASPCVTGGIGCDTVVVYVLDSIHVEFNVDPGAFCQGNIPLIQATVTPSGTTYTFAWYDAYNGTGNLMGSNSDFQPPTPGPYSLVVTDMQEDVPCGIYTYNFNVAPDDTPPIVTPPSNITLECNDPANNQTIQDWLASATALDDHSPNLQITNDYAGITQACGSSLTINFSASDECGNTGFASAIITITDTQIPFWLTASGDLNRILECSDATAIAAAQALQPIATDQCDALLVLTKTSGVFVAGVCPQTGTYTNTWTATDDCGNISLSYTQVISIRDLTAPVWISAPGLLNRTLDCNNTAGLADAQALTPAASDNCDASLSPVKSAGTFVTGSCANAGTYTNTWTVTDACGNTSLIYTQIISINDANPPVITTPASSLSVECDGSGNTAALNNWLNSHGGAVATDACGPVSWSHNFTNLSDLCGSTGIATITFTATDACSHSVTTQASFSIVDTESPILNCSPDVTAQVDPLNCEATSVELGNPVFSDLCSGPVTISNNAPDFFSPGITIVTWTATDACGNQSSCDQTITVTDNQPPDVSCPADVSVDADAGQCSANVTVPAPVVDDPCPYTVSNNINGTADASGNYPVGITIVTWTITGISGNTSTCHQSVTVTDNQAPVIVCPPDAIATAPAPECTVQVLIIEAPVFSDNCDEALLSLSWEKTGATTESGSGNVNGTTFNTGITTVIYTVSDTSENTASCQFTVTVHDEIPPTVITCPVDITANAGSGNCEADITVPAPEVVDGCNEIVTISHNSLYGNNATDASGTYPVGIHLITWTFTDESGNISSCQQAITVNDLFDPQLVCPPSVVMPADLNQNYATNVETDLPVYSDNCDVTILSWEMTGATVANSPLTGINLLTAFTYNLGITTITYTATDPSGNTSSCSFTVNITSKPEISCPDDIITDTDPDECSALLDPGQPVVIDGGEPMSWSWSVTGATTANGTGRPITPIPFLFNAGTTTITWTASNASGSGECSQTITVIDHEPPVFIIPTLANGYCVEGFNAAVYNPGGNYYVDDLNPHRRDYFILSTGNNLLDITGISDNCPGQPAVHWDIDFGNNSSIDLSGDGQISASTPLNFPLGANLITYTVTDAYGNDTSAFVIFTVLPRPDITDP